MDALILRAASASEPGVTTLIATHFALMRESSPEESCHVQPADALEKDGAFLLAAEQDGHILGIGAIKEIAPGHGEIKSMHTAQAARGKGIARQILLGLIRQSRARGLTTLSLETGSMDLFAPARALYAAEGFTVCPPFGDYAVDPLSVFMSRQL